MPSYCRYSPAFELAPDFTWPQLFAIGKLLRHAHERREQLTALQRQLVPLLGFTPRRENAAAPLGRPTLLVGDDQPVARAITRDILEGLGCAVILTDGNFQDVPISARFDAVLLDVPLLTERHLTRIGRAGRFSRHIVVSTPLPEGLARARMRQAGARAFVSKPFHPLTLARSLQEVLGN